MSTSRESWSPTQTEEGMPLRTAAGLKERWKTRVEAKPPSKSQRILEPIDPPTRTLAVWCLASPTWFLWCVVNAVKGQTHYGTPLNLMLARALCLSVYEPFKIRGSLLRRA